MTNLPEPDQTRRGLDAAPRAIVDASALRDTFRALLGADVSSCQAGWPTLAAKLPLRESDAWIELSDGLDARYALALAVPAESAARWVDRALGGQGDSGIAGASGTLSEAECGVLAYLAARACKALGNGWQVRDVKPTAALDPAALLWPLSFEGALGPCTLTCALAPWWVDARLDAWVAPSDAQNAPSGASDARYQLALSVFEQAPSAPLQRGEVWVSDRWNLSHTSDGLAGEARASVAGCATGLAIWMGRGRMHAYAPSPARTDALEVVLAREPVRFAELAALGAGEARKLPAFAEVELRVRGELVGRGELASWRGAVGVIVREV